MRQILVPVDGSEGAARAARFAAYLASETGATITLLHVFDAPTATVLGLASLTGPAAQEAVERVAAGSFASATAEMGEFDVEVDTRVAVGHPAREIVAFARQQHPQLIVMGTRGRSAVEEALLGSVCAHVLHHAPCPVTVHR